MEIVQDNDVLTVESTFAGSIVTLTRPGLNRWNCYLNSRLRTFVTMEEQGNSSEPACNEEFSTNQLPKCEVFSNEYFIEESVTGKVLENQESPRKSLVDNQLKEATAQIQERIPTPEFPSDSVAAMVLRNAHIPLIFVKLARSYLVLGSTIRLKIEKHCNQISDSYYDQEEIDNLKRILSTNSDNISHYFSLTKDGLTLSEFKKDGKSIDLFLIT